MKLVTPLTDIKDFQVLRESGADEFYLGYIPYSWLGKYFNHLPLNGRERMYADFSFHSSSSIKKLREISDGVELYITLNAHYYNEEAYQEILTLVDCLYELDYKKFIVADYNLILLLSHRYEGMELAISGDMGLFNSLALEYVADQHVKRMIFPRKTPLAEMRQMIKNTKKYNLEYEAFALNELCYFSGAFCNAYHCDELLRICRLPKKLVAQNGTVMKEENFQKRQSNLSSNTDTEAYVLGKSGCGLCKIKEMQSIGVTHLKLVGRGKKTGHLIQDIKIMKELMNSEITRSSEFEDYVRKAVYQNHCPKDCYYVDRNLSLSWGISE